jgi:hypothetical protein
MPLVVVAVLFKDIAPMNTYKLNTGVHVLARPLKDGSLYPYTYINRTQAENAARKHDGEVYQSHFTRRVFYVTPKQEIAP